MTIEEFKARMENDEEWAPGWDIIDDAFDEVYPNGEYQHYAINMAKRAIFGGDQFLDGYSIYNSSNGYKHIVTYGMTELYADEKAFGGEFNKWGYEMTIKLKEPDNDSCMWALTVLGNLARYTYTSERWFEPYQYVAGNGGSLNLDKPECKITALLIVDDTEVKGRDTIYGRTDFMQLVGITEQELQALKADYSRAKELAEMLKTDYPNLETDMYRTHSYL